MSDKKSQKSETVEEFERRIEEERYYDRLRKETSRDEAVVRHQRMKSERVRAEQDEADLATLRDANFGIQSAESIAEIVKNNTEYIAAAKQKMGFIFDSKAVRESEEVSFDRVVPFFRKNIILIGAVSGEGKSTTVANIAYFLMTQKNPRTGKPAKILILSNEEKTEDIYNRITCLGTGWKYSNHDQLTPEQVERFNKAIPALASRITVINQNHNGSQGATTSIEGIGEIFDNLIAKQDHYDAILIDYYQNVCISKKNPHLSEFEVQARLTRMLDSYKNVYPAPIVMLAQLNPASDENENYFPAKLQGRKLIINVSTCILEMIVNKKERVTKWKVWKSRFNDCVGEEIETGFENGRFVPYTAQFKLKVAEYWAQREKYKLDQQTKEKNLEIDKKNGLPDAFKDKDGKPESEPK
jgi:hypothetical protein